MVSIDTLAAVHHPVRRRIIDHLVIHGPAQVGTLATTFGEQVGSISHHLRMLERAGVVERAPELATDGRASWWRHTSVSISWDVDDFDRPADQHRARVAEKLNVERQFGKLVAWRKLSERMPVRWRRAAFSTDSLGTATPEELTDLCTRLVSTIRAWKTEIDPEDGQDREPVFVFAHGFPSQP